MKNYISLYEMLSTKTPLNTDQKANLFELLKGRTHKRTRILLTEAIEQVHLIQKVGIFNRVIFKGDDDKCEYHAGQHYPSEIATVRECILNGYYSTCNI